MDLVQVVECTAVAVSVVWILAFLGFLWIAGRHHDEPGPVRDQYTSPDPPNGPNPFARETWTPDSGNALFVVPSDDQVFVPKPDPALLWAPDDIPMPCQMCGDIHPCADTCKARGDGIHMCSLPPGHTEWHECACGDHSWHVRALAVDHRRGDG